MEEDKAINANMPKRRISSYPKKVDLDGHGMRPFEWKRRKSIANIPEKRKY